MIMIILDGPVPWSPWWFRRLAIPLMSLRCWLVCSGGRRRPSTRTSSTPRTGPCSCIARMPNSVVSTLVNTGSVLAQRG